MQSYTNKTFVSLSVLRKPEGNQLVPNLNVPKIFTCDQHNSNMSNECIPVVRCLNLKYYKILHWYLPPVTLDDSSQEQLCGESFSVFMIKLDTLTATSHIRRQANYDKILQIGFLPHLTFYTHSVIERCYNGRGNGSLGNFSSG